MWLGGLTILGRQRRDLVLENLILRQQLAVWERSGRRPSGSAVLVSHGAKLERLAHPSPARPTRDGRGLASSGLAHY